MTPLFFYTCAYKNYFKVNIYDFKTTRYFSWPFILLSVFVSVFGFVLLMKSIIGGLLVLTGCILVFSTHYGISIDFDKKEFRDYVWILGMKQGDKTKFDTIEYLFIKKAQLTQTMGLRAATSTIQKDVFDGYLKFSEQDKVHIMTKDRKESLLEKLKPISKKLNIKIIDYSEGEYAKTLE